MKNSNQGTTSTIQAPYLIENIDSLTDDLRQFTQDSLDKADRGDSIFVVPEYISDEK